MECLYWRKDNLVLKSQTPAEGGSAGGPTGSQCKLLDPPGGFYTVGRESQGQGPDICIFQMPPMDSVA